MNRQLGKSRVFFLYKSIFYQSPKTNMTQLCLNRRRGHLPALEWPRRDEIPSPPPLVGWLLSPAFHGAVARRGWLIHAEDRVAAARFRRREQLLLPDRGMGGV